jgi:O-antigen ligase
MCAAGLALSVGVIIESWMGVAHQPGRNTAAKCLLLFVPSLGGGRSAAAAVGVISMQKPLKERVVTQY